MIIDIVSLIIGLIFGFIIGVALIKETSNNMIHEYFEENIRHEYEKQILEENNRRLKDTLIAIDDETLKVYQKSEDMLILYHEKENK